MKKQLTLLSLGLILAGSNLGFSQEKKIYSCNTDEAMDAHFAANPGAKARFEKEQKTLRDAFDEKQQNMGANRTAAVVYTIPVVFHILHQGGPENVTDAQCIAALQQVNEDFSRLGADTSQIVPSHFKTRYVDSEIRFMLAKKDPQGNCITGIVRHIDAKTQWSQSAAGSSPAYWPYTWNPTQYMNIYVVANIVPQTTVVGGGQIGGYTYRPGTWPTFNNRDAIVYRYSLLGAGPPGYDARSLSHEIGHWLNLPHTFGNTNNPGINCGDDGLSDTPVTKGNYNACPAVSTNSNITCQNNLSLYWQNPQNFMDYSNCPLNFTTDQSNSMRNTLVVGTSGRNNLITANNLSVGFTDVNGAGICAPIAQFLSTTNIYTVCAGGSLTMKSFSYNGIITSYQWTANNVTTIAAATSSITLMTFNTVGTTNVTLTVSNAQGSSSVVKVVTVINGAAAITGPYSESFENPGLPPNWMVNTTPANGLGWDQAIGVALDGTNSYSVEGANTLGGQITTLQMPTMDLLNNPNCTFKFAYTYARASSTHNDVFKVQMSKDCGGSWTDALIKSSFIMATESSGITNDPTPYAPALLTDNALWKIIQLDAVSPQWGNFVNSATVWLRFSFEEAAGGGGNNFYLDAINFFVPNGINELTKSISLNLYPNPATGETNLNFTLSDPASVKLSIVDVLGKDILPAVSYQLNAGEQNMVINKDHSLAKGVYFVNLTMNGTNMSRKLIIN
ncbi:MAG: M43 family zinc metalloprotease [Bacteroidota bacterium]